MNKSLASNLIAVLLIISGYLLKDNPMASYLLNMGLFAFSGALTNWLAVHMLFERVPLLYGSGVVPNHFEDFKKGIHALIMEQFFTQQNIDRLLAGSIDGIKVDGGKLAQIIDYSHFFQALKAAILDSGPGAMLKMVGGEKIISGMEEDLIGALKNAVQQQLASEKFNSKLNESVGSGHNSGVLQKQVSEIVERRLGELTPQKVKEIVAAMIRRHLGWLVVWGAVFGAVIGLVMSLIRG